MTELPSSHEDEAMRRLLHDAVDDVEPRDSLHQIRSRTRSQSTSRPWVWGIGGAVAASAATVAAIAVMGGDGGTTGARDPDFAGSPAATASSEPTPTQEPSETATTAAPPAETIAVPVYYVGETPQGPRLYREFQEASIADGDTDATIDEALDRAVGETPLDPDYRTVWPEGTEVQFGFDGVSPDGQWSIALRNAGTDLRQRPAGMSELEAQMAVDQLIYTVHAAAQDADRQPVQFFLERAGAADARTDMLLGVPVSEPLAAGEPIQTLALAQVTTPEQGAEVSGSFVADGIASSFEATVPWQVRQGERVVLEGFATAEGWMDRLYPWRTEPIDVSGLEPGEYTFVAMTSDPSGGAEGNGPHEDTKQITVVR